MSQIIYRIGNSKKIMPPAGDFCKLTKVTKKSFFTWFGHSHT